MTAPVRVAAAVVWRDGAVLLTRRPPGVRHALEWEFPGGKLEPGETAEEAIVREVREELGVEAVPHETLAIERHAYGDDLHVEIAFVRCTLAGEEFHPHPAIHEVRWIEPARVNLDEVLAADRGFLASLRPPEAAVRERQRNAG